MRRRGDGQERKDMHPRLGFIILVLQDHLVGGTSMLALKGDELSCILAPCYLFLNENSVGCCFSDNDLLIGSGVAIEVYVHEGMGLFGVP